MLPRERKKTKEGPLWVETFKLGWNIIRYMPSIEVFKYFKIISSLVDNKRPSDKFMEVKNIGN